MPNPIGVIQRFMVRLGGYAYFTGGCALFSSLNDPP